MILLYIVVRHVTEVEPHCQVVLQRCPTAPIMTFPDDRLAIHLCQNLAIHSIPYTAVDSLEAECLLLLRQILLPYPFLAEYIIASLVADDAAPITVLQVALVRDCLNFIYTSLRASEK
jgi:hypothetical protein